ncbi:hypothetical protein [Sulfurimonas sp.]|uniref:hypothetical protein n=1 Tax=Sulfurimonas sp. TaxID=2022749 RepID=UPI00261E31D3|nr:hypothetical protein [Sulfurimonas sp.]
MTKKILILIPKNIKKGQPSFERIHAYIEFYTSHNIEVIQWSLPNTFSEKIKLIILIYKHQIKNIFISMPPFRNWFLFLLFNVHIIIDIRDGWSIAMKTGYGGTAKKNIIKASLASYYERLAIKRASLAITCTGGLQSYLEDLTKKKILLITNGYSKHDLELVNKIYTQGITKNNALDSIVVCAGQFSEYGQDKVKKILKNLNRKTKPTLLKLIGSNIGKNKWIQDWIIKNSLNNIKIEFLPRMNRKEMYEEILLADYGIAVIRDPNYDFGTKVFDYILCRIPILDYFESKNNFVDFFQDQLTSSNNKSFNRSFLRNELIEKQKKLLLGVLK